MRTIDTNIAVSELQQVRAGSVIPTSIPRISEDQKDNLDALVARIKPVRRENGRLFWLDTKPFHPHFQTFAYARTDGPALYIWELRDIFTLHVYGSQTCFQPVESEVLTFIIKEFPAELLNAIIAYEVHWISDWKEIPGLHLSKTAIFVPEPWRRAKLAFFSVGRLFGRRI